VRDNATANYEKTIRAIADMGFACVEPAGFPGTTVEQAAKLFKELELSAPTCHCGLPIGENKNQIIETAQAIGIKYLITGCPPAFKTNFESADAIKACAALYVEAANNVAKFGMQVGYHNHDWEMADIDGKPGYRWFLENTPSTVLFEADLFWVSFGGRSVVDIIKELGPRAKALHFKDGRLSNKGVFEAAETASGKIMVSKDKPFLPAGTGNVDLVSASKVATQTEYVVVELDAYAGDMMQAVKQSYDYLTKTGIAQGRK
jgi:sugar phosphate isomerase/epimerase